MTYVRVKSALSIVTSKVSITRSPPFSHCAFRITIVCALPVSDRSWGEAPLLPIGIQLSEVALLLQTFYRLLLRLTTMFRWSLQPKSTATAATTVTLRRMKSTLPQNPLRRALARGDPQLRTARSDPLPHQTKQNLRSPLVKI